MFAFFIALFGGLYIIFRLSAEGAGNREYDRKMSQRMAIKEKLMNDLKDMWYPEHWEYIYDGTHYEDICSEFEEDFLFIFGSEWKDILDLPPKPEYEIPVSGNYTNYSKLPHNHIYWVYYLLLASKGITDHDLFFPGFGVDPHCQDVCIRFAQRIEHHLNKHGHNIRLVFEYEEHQPPEYMLKRDPYGWGYIKIDVLCDYPNRIKRLW